MSDGDEDFEHDAVQLECDGGDEDPTFWDRQIDLLLWLSLLLLLAVTAVLVIGAVGR